MSSIFLSDPTINNSAIDFEEVFTLLSRHQQEHKSLTVPLNNPMLHRIIDILTANGIETLAQLRWEEMIRQVESDVAVSNATPDKRGDVSPEGSEWLQLQRGPYRLYQEETHEENQDAESSTEKDPEKTLGWAKKPNPLNAARYNRLRNLRNAGVVMNKWEERLLELKQFHSEKGHCDVPLDYPGGLGIWCATQRVSYRFDKATVPQSRINALDAIGFTWQSQKRKDAWSRYFDELVEYIRQHGTSHVSVYDENYTRLGSWVKRQRAEYKKYQLRGRTNSQMTKERIDKLDSIGFQWRLKAEKLTWDDRFEALKIYKMTHGHCRPPQNENPELNTWSRYQRLNYQYFIEGKPSRLNQEKVDKLLSIGINEPAVLSRGEEEKDGNEVSTTVPEHSSFV
ncbi:hypothetical protein ACHAW6_011015 [Cyclotella cf. meneghiniana]